MLSPYQHGEVFVLDDGGETDLDLGHYERFIDIRLTKTSSVTTGKIYQGVLDRERAGGFNGRTIQVIPNITDEICRRIKEISRESKADFVLVEVGGTVGDIEGEPFIEALRQMRRELPPEDTLNVHVTWLPYIQATEELKTKPTQHSVRTLRSMGVAPDVIIARSDHPVPQNLCQKISDFCDIELPAVIPLVTCKQLYEIPLTLHKSGISDYIFSHMQVKPPQKPDWAEWEWLIKETNRKNKPTVKIGLVGKYVELHDAYLSVREAVHHAALHHGIKLDLHWIHAEKIQNGDSLEELNRMDGIIIPSGIGSRGFEGMIRASEYARTSGTPFLGICMGMQAMAIEFARNQLGLSNANSVEFDEKTSAAIFDTAESLGLPLNAGPYVRLGLHASKLKRGTLIMKAYDKQRIEERHNHQFEFNKAFCEPFEAQKMKINAQDDGQNLVDGIELAGHPFMVGVMFNPEFLSRPNRPHPLISLRERSF